MLIKVKEGRAEFSMRYEKKQQPNAPQAARKIWLETRNSHLLKIDHHCHSTMHESASLNRKVHSRRAAKVSYCNPFNRNPMF